MSAEVQVSLKPCPRCQGCEATVRLVHLDFGLGLLSEVNCDDCGHSARSSPAKGKNAEGVTRAEAIAAWNTRTSAQADSARLIAMAVDVAEYFRWKDEVAEYTHGNQRRPPIAKLAKMKDAEDRVRAALRAQAPADGEK